MFPGPAPGKRDAVSGSHRRQPAESGSDQGECVRTCGFERRIVPSDCGQSAPGDEPDAFRRPDGHHRPDPDGHHQSHSHDDGAHGGRHEPCADDDEPASDDHDHVDDDLHDDHDTAHHHHNDVADADVRRRLVLIGTRPTRVPCPGPSGDAAGRRRP